MSEIAIKKPIILALETSGRIGSVALAVAGRLVAEKTFSTPVRHSAEIFPAITGLLESSSLGPQQIDHIYISTGPGSFTGLRIAAAFAKIMHLANNNIKIVAVDTLDCIASNVIDFQKQTKTEVKKIAAILDAKRGQFFTAVYERKSINRAATVRERLKEGATAQRERFARGFADCWDKTIDDCLSTAQEFIERFADPNNPVWLLGEGLVFYKIFFEAKGIEFIDDQFWRPSASKVLLLGYRLALAGRFADPLALVPRYIQRPDIIPKNI
ncbi:MAG: tRNA (adenosine(37)-N6)-threonylcarbamoyltransferase complex dimerization subunit type 1 TsaB [bacterium]|nr:tRNA (adenosine(37)-N6)-threonylcarbamoyltransferase complex dimerization subunit type 1 TsaB [bacterium]